MSVQNAFIRPLPPDVVAQIKSSITITHLGGVVLELLKNALDAKASSVSISINFERGGCVVEDDGHGIPSEEFEPGGGLGKIHHTSKWGCSQEVYGQRGMFLASLASLSLLTITSHHELDTTTNTAAFHHSRPISRLAPAPPQHRLECRAHGTRVTVHDLFGNMPVRVKHRALNFAKSDDLDREWESLKMILTGLLLATDKAVKVAVSSSDKSRKFTFRYRSEISREMGSRGEDQGEQGVLDLERVQTTLSQAGYINPSNFGSWVTVSARTAVLSVASAISLEPSPTKQVQFISFGIHPMPPQNNANVIYEEINRIFSLSSFGNVEDSSETVDADSTPSKPRKQEQGNGIAKRKAGGSSKGVNRWPMFYIRISARDQGTKRIFDNEPMPESDRSLQIVLDVIGTMMHNFLEQHHFRPRARKRVRWSKIDSPPPASNHEEPKETDRAKRKRSSPRDLPQRSKPPKTTENFLDGNTKLPSFSGAPSHHHPARVFGSWSRVKTGTRNSFEDIFSGLSRGKVSSCGEPYGKNSRGTRKDDSTNESSITSPLSTSTVLEPKRSSSVNALDASKNASEEDLSDVVDKAISWTDPLTKTAVLLNSRTGQVMQPAECVSARGSATSQRPCSMGSLHKSSSTMRNVRPKTVERSESDSWIENLLRKWENPIFHQSEKPIPSVSIDASNILPPDQRSCDIKVPPSTRHKGKLTKSELERAQVIAQVDNKFILVRMVAASEDAEDGKAQEQSLVLIDQHAADERCRIEQLFRDLFESSRTTHSGTSSIAKVQTTVLAKPLVFRVSPQEARLFESYMKFFASWGCLYKLSTNAQQIQSAIVTGLPTLISERCRLEPKLAIDMLRGEIWAREEGTRTISKSSSSTHHPMDASVPPKSAAEVATAGKDDDTSWLERITHCPQGIIDMLNSRSCRSAIMFNDILSPDECKELVARLSRCAFPFQCAHGRPSMVPIVNLGNSDAAGEFRLEGELGLFDDLQPNRAEEGDGGLSPGLAQAFRIWQGL